MKRQVCAECGCHLRVKTLDGRVACAACGAEKRIRLRITGKGERCHFCIEPDHRGRFPAGKLCEQGGE